MTNNLRSPFGQNWVDPQMDAGPYAHAHHAECCYGTSLEDISVPAAEAKCPTVYDYV